MKQKKLKEKIAMVRAARENNYRESLRLEGFTEISTLHGKTKSEVIQYYTDQAAK